MANLDYDAIVARIEACIARVYQAMEERAAEVPRAGVAVEAARQARALRVARALQINLEAFCLTRANVVDANEVRNKDHGDGKFPAGL
jgi:hypothetical protein